MSRRTFGALAVIAAIVLLPQAVVDGHGELARASTAKAEHPRTYDDFIGDSGEAPDFSASEIVTNDNKTITIGIQVHNRDGFTSSDDYRLFIDSDTNPGTGQPETGAEYLITVGKRGAQIARWTGLAFGPFSATLNLPDWLRGYGPVLVLRRYEIGGASAFDFVLVSTDGTSTDRAPNESSWQYQLTPFALEARPVTIGAARAGRMLTARTLVMRGDFDVPLTAGVIGCRASISDRTLVGRGAFIGDLTTCRWRLPRDSAGKRLVGSVAVAFEGAKAGQSFSVRIGR